MRKILGDLSIDNWLRIARVLVLTIALVLSVILGSRTSYKNPYKIGDQVFSDFFVLIPIGLILIGGTLIYLFALSTHKGPESVDEMHVWAVPWLFGTVVAGGYLGWFYTWGYHIAIVILFTIIGCFFGAAFGAIGLITDPGSPGDAVQQYFTVLALLSIPVSVVLGTLIGKIWVIPGPAIGCCLGPLLFLSLLYLVDKNMRRRRPLSRLDGKQHPRRQQD